MSSFKSFRFTSKRQKCFASDSELSEAILFNSCNIPVKPWCHPMTILECLDSVIHSEWSGNPAKSLTYQRHGFVSLQKKKHPVAATNFVKVGALYLPFIVQGFWSLPDNCPNGISYPYSGPIYFVVSIHLSTGSLMLVIEFPWWWFWELNILLFSYQPLGELSSLKTSNSSEATSL